MKDFFANFKRSFAFPSPIEDEKLLLSRKCGLESVRLGAKAAATAFVASAIPTMITVRKVPWARANLNYAAQAMIVSSASMAAYFITADKSIMATAKKNAQAQRNPGAC